MPEEKFLNKENVDNGVDNSLSNPLSNTGSIVYRNFTSYTKYKVDKNVCVDYLKFRVTGNFDFESKFVFELFDILKLNYLEYDRKNTKTFKAFYTFDEDVFIYYGQENTQLINGKDCWFFEMKGHALRMFEFLLIVLLHVLHHHTYYQEILKLYQIHLPFHLNV